MATFKEALSKVILNLFSLSVHVTLINFVTVINCFLLTCKTEIDQLSHEIIQFIVWNNCVNHGKVISCCWRCFISTVKFLDWINNRLVVLFRAK